MPGLVHRVPGMERIAVRHGVAYAPPDDAGGRPRTLAVALPPGDAPTRGHPVLLLVHGAVPPTVPVPPTRWPPFVDWMRVAAAHGMAGVALDHRLVDEGDHDEAADDLAAALRFLRERGAEIGVDGSRVCLLVFSAGGPLASGAIAGDEPAVRCVALYYARLDGDALPAARSPRRALARRATGAPPLLVARAGRDDVPGLNAGLDRFVGDAVARDVPLALLRHPTGVHGFDARTDDAWSRAIVAATLAFARESLRADAPRGTR